MVADIFDKSDEVAADSCISLSPLSSLSNDSADLQLMDDKPLDSNSGRLEYLEEKVAQLISMTEHINEGLKKLILKLDEKDVKTEPTSPVSPKPTIVNPLPSSKGDISK